MPSTTPDTKTAAGLPEHGRVLFSDFVVDLARGELMRRGEAITLRPKTFAVLRYLLQHAGHLVPREKLLAAVWPGVVVTDDSITQCLLELRRALGDDERRIVRTVPRRGIIFDTPVRFEEASVATPSQASSRTGRSLAAIIFALAALTALLTGWNASSTPAYRAAPAGHSIAVLPFVDRSPKADRDYFAEGISEEILHRLAQNPDLTVTARTSSFAFKGTHTDIRTIAAQLDVENLLEGSVRVDGDAVRITAQLVSAKDGRQRWSQVYERRLGELFGVQSDIAEQVARTLQVDVFNVAQPPDAHVPEPEAYRLMLEGHVLYQQRAEGDMTRARDLFRRSVEVDPDYALGWARLAAATRILFVNGQIDYEELIRTGLSAAKRALELRPDLAEVQFRAGDYAVIVGDYTVAWKYHNQARRIEPNHPLVLGLFAGRALLSGDTSSAVELQMQLVRQDPLAPGARKNLVYMLFHAGQFGAMRKHAIVSMGLAPGRKPDIMSLLVRAAILEHDSNTALSLLESLPDGLQRDAALALLGGWPSHQEEADRAMQRLTARGSMEAIIHLAEAEAWQGDVDAAFVSLGRARRLYDAAENALPVYGPILESRVSPFLTPLHEDPRWAGWLANLPLQDIFAPSGANVYQIAQE